MISHSLRSEVLKVHHSSNGGMTCMTSRAGVSIWWPRITALSYKPSKEWLVTKEQRELALAKRYAKQEEVWSEHTKTLPELPVGTMVRVQNQAGNKPKRWDRTGLIVEVLPHLQYRVRMDGSGDISLRNRRFLRKITPIQSVIQNPDPPPASPRSEAATPPEPRRSGRVRTMRKIFQSSN